jgi:membrane protease YdiL (CAAX protease family)
VSRAVRAGVDPSHAVSTGADAAGRERRSGYLDHSSSPLVSLAFILPMVVIYEIGTHGLGSGIAERAVGTTPQHVIAFTLLQHFFGLFGATGQSLPALAIVGILLTWHVARHDRWSVRWPTLGGMAIEASVLCIPLLASSVVLAQALRMLPMAGHQAIGVAPLPRDDLFILCLGAGIYEELVFRLILLTVLTLLVKDLLQFHKPVAVPLVVLLSAVAFAGYHYLGPEPFLWRTFAFRSMAGIYFGVLFLTRGFGVTAATHAAYDILVLLILP